MELSRLMLMLMLILMMMMTLADGLLEAQLANNTRKERERRWITHIIATTARRLTCFFFSCSSYSSFFLSFSASLSRRMFDVGGDVLEACVCARCWR